MTGPRRVTLVGLVSVALVGALGCTGTGTPASWPAGSYEAAFFVVLDEDGAPRLIDGPFAVGPDLRAPWIGAKRNSDRVVFVGLDLEVMRALPGAYDEALAASVVLLPEPEDCPHPGRLLGSVEGQKTRVALPEAVALFDLDPETGLFSEPTDRTPFDAWSLEYAHAGWCDESDDIQLRPFELSAPFARNVTFSAIVRIDDDRVLVGDDRAIYLAERGRRSSNEPGRAVILREDEEDGPELRLLLLDPVRSTSSRKVIIGTLQEERRAEGGIIELVLDESGLYEARRVALASGPIWSALIEPDGSFFAVGGRSIDPDDGRGPAEGMVLTATTTAGPFHVTTVPGLPTRTMAHGPDPDVPHWIGTTNGLILRGDLRRGIESFERAVPEAGAIYAIVLAGTKELGVTGWVTTSLPALFELDGETWKRSTGFALPPRLRDCEAVGAVDACGQKRWGTPRGSEAAWSPHRPWEARFAPLCDAHFMWNERERCLTIAVPDLAATGGAGRLITSTVDQEGRRLTVAGTGGRILEAWLPAP